MLEKGLSRGKKTSGKRSELVIPSDELIAKARKAAFGETSPRVESSEFEKLKTRVTDIEAKISDSNASKSPHPSL